MHEEESWELEDNRRRTLLAFFDKNTCLFCLHVNEKSLKHFESSHPMSALPLSSFRKIILAFFLLMKVFYDIIQWQFHVKKYKTIH